jgi:hypothetical protein
MLTLAVCPRPAALAQCLSACASAFVDPCLPLAYRLADHFRTVAQPHRRDRPWRSGHAERLRLGRRGDRSGTRDVPRLDRLGARGNDVDAGHERHAQHRLCVHLPMVVAFDMPGADAFLGLLPPQTPSS